MLCCQRGTEALDSALNPGLQTAGHYDCRHPNAFVYLLNASVLLPTFQGGFEVIKEQVCLDIGKKKPTINKIQHMHDFWSQKGACMNPALLLSSCVSLGSSFPSLSLDVFVRTMGACRAFMVRVW